MPTTNVLPPCYKDGNKTIHPNAKEVPGSQEDGWPSGDTVLIRCPDCGKEWTEEIAQ